MHNNIKSFALGATVAVAAVGGLSAVSNDAAEPVESPSPVVNVIEGGTPPVGTPVIPEDVPETSPYEDALRGFSEDGFTIGDVIVCDAGTTVIDDHYGHGISWAACM